MVRGFQLTKDRHASLLSAIHMATTSGLVTSSLSSDVNVSSAVSLDAFRGIKAHGLTMTDYSRCPSAEAACCEHVCSSSNPTLHTQAHTRTLMHANGKAF
ncbi:unnamed protein product [Protopolystoma xenopodis]|uniref:Uncharacterized protein n=1 Tax=Protopolystoma xenopodis TaxID=117903 RepID=A0A3S5B9R5_9PLAT|nr:unnamed protein product [Protopolystoma xenopodis]